MISIRCTPKLIIILSKGPTVGEHLGKFYLRYRRSGVRHLLQVTCNAIPAVLFIIIIIIIIISIQLERLKFRYSPARIAVGVGLVSIGVSNTRCPINANVPQQIMHRIREH